MNVASLSEANRLRMAAVEAGDCPLLHAAADAEMLRLFHAHGAALLAQRALARLARREQSRAADRQAAGESREVQS